MSGLTRLVAPLAAAVLVVFAPVAAAKTYTGSISAPVVSADGASVSAQVTVSSSCTAGEYCGYFAEVLTVEDPTPCQPVINGSEWIGPLVSTSYGSVGETLPLTTATWSEYPHLYAGPKHACLYAAPDDVLVAQVPYTVPSPAPLPTYTPPAYTPPVTPAPVPVTQTITEALPDLPFLSRVDAVTRMRAWTKRRYGHVWTKGRLRVTKCPVRSSDAQLGCFSVWSYRGRVHSKTIVVTEDAYGDFTYSRDFASAPAQVQVVTVPAGTPAPASAPPTDFCATHVCIPNYDNGTGSTVQCSDGTYSQSGGKQGACSHHGGVGRAMAAARASGSGSGERRQAALARASASRRARTTRLGALSKPPSSPA